jgi:Ca2+-binding EF-hand superfamily protein
MLDFQSDEKSLQGLFRRYDVDRSGYITIDELGRLLFKQDDDTVTKARTVIAKMREVLTLRAGGYASLNALGRQFRIADRDGSGIMAKSEFDIALDLFFAYYKVNLTPAQKNSLFQFFDRDNSGTVSYDEFVRGVRGDMNDFRVNWVMQAFDILDKDKSGIISIEELASTYDVSQNPAVRSGKVTAREAIQNFMAQWDNNRDGTVTKEEFIEAYQWVSSSIDSDDYFELMMRNAWHISGGSGWCENTSNLRVLVIHFDGSQEVVEVQDDLGLRRDDYTGIMRRLQQQGVKNIKKIEVASGM